MRTHVLLGACLVLAIPAGRCRAQRISPIAPVTYRSTTGQSVAGEQATLPPARVAAGIAGGIAGGAAGLLVGMFGGLAISEAGNCQGEDCGLLESIVGLAVGESVGMAIGTHLGSRGHGNLAVAALTSTFIGVAGLYALAGTDGSPVVLCAIPVIQLGALLALER